MRGPTGAGLGHAVLPRALAGAAHDEQVARPGREADATVRRRLGRSRNGRTAPNDTSATDRGRQLAGHPVAVPGHAVGAVAVEVRPDLGELDAVAGRQPPRHRGQVRRRLGERPPVGEPRLGQHPVVHPHPPRASPRRLGQQPGEQRVGARAPAGGYVHPRAVPELMPPGRKDLQPVEQRRLPHQIGDHAPTIRQIEQMVDTIRRAAASPAPGWAATGPGRAAAAAADGRRAAWPMR